MGEWSIAQLDKVGTIGLAVLVVGLVRLLGLILKGELVTKREMDREISRCERLEQRLDKALDYGDRALGAGEQIRERLPAKK